VKAIVEIIGEPGSPHCLLDDEDIPRIRQMGVMAFFPRGTSFKAIVEWSLENIKAK